MHPQGVAGLVTGGPENDIRALIDEGHKPLNQMVDKAVFVQVVGLLHGDVQDFGGLNVAVFAAGNKLRVHAQMTDTVRGDLLCQRDGHNFFIAGNEPPGLFGDLIQGIQAVLDDAQPPLIHLLMQNLVILLQGGASCLHHFEHILEIAVFFQCSSNLIDIFQVQIVDGVGHKSAPCVPSEFI